MNPAAVSALDGSCGDVSESRIGEPSFTAPGALNVAVGATLFTVTVKEAVPVPPSSSVTFTVTV